MKKRGRVQQAYDELTIHQLVAEALSMGISEMVLVLKDKRAMDDYLFSFHEEGIITYGVMTKNAAIKNEYSSFVIKGITVHYKKG